MLLRMELDGDWKAAEFAAVFQEVHSLYEHIAIRLRTTALASRDQSEEQLFQISRRAEPLKVKLIQYGSPGFTDFVGLGAIVHEVREFIQFLIVHFRERTDRKLGQEQRQIEIAKAKLEILESLARIKSESETKKHLRSLEAFSQMTDFSDLPGIDAISDAIFDGRIVDTSTLDDENSGSK